MEKKQVVPDIEPVKANGKSSIPVHQYGLNGKYLNTYKSISDAAKASGAKMNSISDCLRGKMKQTGGFQWRKAE